MNRITTSGIAFALSVVLAACGGGDSTGPDNGGTTGSFSVSISGDLTDSFDGQAFFGEATDPETSETGWVLWLTSTEAQTTGQAVYFVRQGSRPGTGTHSLANLDDDSLDQGQIGALVFDYTSGSFPVSLFATSGSLTVTSSSSSGMSGSFTMQATGVVFDGDEPSEVDVTVSGEFSALGGNVFYPGF